MAGYMWDAYHQHDSTLSSYGNFTLGDLYGSAVVYGSAQTQVTDGNGFLGFASNATIRYGAAQDSYGCHVIGAVRGLENAYPVSLNGLGGVVLGAVETLNKVCTVTVSGKGALVGGYVYNTTTRASGDGAWAVGDGAKADHDASFVFGQGLNSRTANSMRINRLDVGPNAGSGPGWPGLSAPIEAYNGAYLDTGGTWQNASSRDLKDNVEDLSADVARTVLAGLNPVTFEYKADRRDTHVGFIAEDVPDLVATPERKGLSSMDIVAVLTKVVQEQQKLAEEQQKRIDQLEADLRALKASK